MDSDSDSDIYDGPAWLISRNNEPIRCFESLKDAADWVLARVDNAIDEYKQNLGRERTNLERCQKGKQAGQSPIDAMMWLELEVNTLDQDTACEEARNNAEEQVGQAVKRIKYNHDHMYERAGFLLEEWGVNYEKVSYYATPIVYVPRDK